MALVTIIVSIIISIVSAFCTVTGIGKIFAGASFIAMGIATVIEIGRVTLVYNLHHYWEFLDKIKKATGICMLLIACSISAMGIFGFLSNAHLEKTMEVTPIVQEIEGKEKQIVIYEDNINTYKVNLEELKKIYGSQASDAGIDELIKRGYVSKAFNFKKDQQKQYDEVFKRITDEQEKIRQLNNEITVLKKQADSVAPELGPLKYIVKLFNVQDQDMAMIIFICMIMCVFDTLAIYLMIMGDWIGKLNTTPQSQKITLKNDVYIPEEIFEDISEEKQPDTIISKEQPIISNTKKVKKMPKKNIIQKTEKIQENNDLPIKNNIDSSYKNIVKLIQTSNNIADNESFKQYLTNHPDVMNRLKTLLHTDDDNQIKESIDKIIKQERK